MSKTVTAAVIYFSSEALASFIAETEDEVMLKVTDWIKTTYKSSERYDLDETLDYFLKDHAMKLITENVKTEYEVRDLQYVGMVDFHITQRLDVAADETEAFGGLYDILKEHWNQFDPSETVIEAVERFDHFYGEGAANYQYISS